MTGNDGQLKEWIIVLKIKIKSLNIILYFTENINSFLKTNMPVNQRVSSLSPCFKL